MKKPYNGDPDQTCPFRLGEKCEVACITCEMFQQYRGMNPNTGQEVDRWQCAISMLSFLMIENSQQQRQTGAAVESFRNEMVKSNDVGHRLLASHVSNGTYQAMHRPNGTYKAIPVGDGTFIAGQLLGVD